MTSPADLDGKPLVAFGATAKHCAFYPMSGDTVAAFAPELEPFETSKGTIRFQPDRPIPLALVKKIVRARIADNERRAGPPKTSRKAGASARRRGTRR